MSEKIKWIGIEFAAFATDEAVQRMTLEEIELTGYCSCTNAATEVFRPIPQAIATILANRVTAQEVSDRIWPKIQSKWVPCPEDLTRVHNEKMKGYIDSSYALVEARSRGGKSKAKLYGGSVPEQSIFDFEPYYKLYPSRGDDYEGRTGGISFCKKYITTQEDYDLLKIAILNYKAKKDTAARLGGLSTADKRKYTMKFSKFMLEWQDFIPKDHRQKAGDSVESTPDQGPRIGGSGYRKAEAAPELQAIPASELPWTPDPYDTEVRRQALAQAWPEERRARWLAGEDVSKE